MKPMSALRIIEVVFQVFGTGCLIGAAVCAAKARTFVQEADRSEGVVVDNLASRDSDGDLTYRAVVEYSQAGGGRGRFNADVASNPPSFEVGERVQILVSRDGSRQSIDSFGQIWFLPVFLAGFGAVFGGIGFAFPIARKRKAEFVRYVKHTGEAVETSDVEVRINRHFSVNDRNPWYLRCKAKVDGVETVFKSGNIWEDPSIAIADRKIRIHYLRQDPKKHWVDIGFLDEGTRLGE